MPHLPEITRLSRGPLGVSVAISEKPISLLPLVFLTLGYFAPVVCVEWTSLSSFIDELFLFALVPGEYLR